MNYITSEFIIENITEIEGFKPYLDPMSGTLEWSNDTIVVYASPNWEEYGIVPVATTNSEGDYYTNILNFTLKGLSLNEQLNRYRNMVGYVINLEK